MSTSHLTSARLDSDDPAIALYLKLKSAPEKTQLQLMQEFAPVGDVELDALMEFLGDRRASLLEEIEPSNALTPDLVAAKAYHLLYTSDSVKAIDFLKAQFPHGIVPLRSEVGADYAPLQTLLAKQEFQAADQLTLQTLCELAGPVARQRKWLYFTDIETFPIVDLRTINALWLVHSEGKFGFSIQREIWLSTGKSWEKMWPKIGWKQGNNWTRYPGGFTWDLTAPRGHLPLSNQLRGVRVIAALLSHPAWSAS